MVALACGTTGLPHILMRSCTNADVRQARKTTLLVMVFGREGIRRMMLGPVAEAIVREARVPVLVVKRSSTRFCVAVRPDE